MSDNADEAFFRANNDWFVGNGASRGPWTADACHAGPVAAVIARALERVVLEKQLTRLTINFRRPIPISGFRVDAEIERDGRSATTAMATLCDEDDQICATASSLHLVTHSYANMPSASVPHPSFEEAKSGEFCGSRALHGLPFFSTSIDVAYPPGETEDLRSDSMQTSCINISKDTRISAGVYLISQHVMTRHKFLPLHCRQNGEIPNRRCSINIADMPVNTIRLSQPNQVANVDG